MGCRILSLGHLLVDRLLRRGAVDDERHLLDQRRDPRNRRAVDAEAAADGGLLVVGALDEARRHGGVGGRRVGEVVHVVRLGVDAAAGERGDRLRVGELEQVQRLTVTPTNVCVDAARAWRCWGQALNNEHDEDRLYPVVRRD